MHSFPKQTHSIGNTKLWWGKSVPPLRAYQNKNMKKRNKNRKKPNGLKQTVFEAGLELFPAHPPKLWTIGKCDSKQKKKKKMWKRVHVKSKKKISMWYKLAASLFFEKKKGGTKQKQNKQKEQSSGSVFAVTVRNGCVLFWQCLLLTYRKEPRVREK